MHSDGIKVNGVGGTALQFAFTSNVSTVRRGAVHHAFVRRLLRVGEMRDNV